MSLKNQYTTKEAIAFLTMFNMLTKYRIAKIVGANPSSVQQWTQNTKMSKAYAAEFLTHWNMTITDAV